LAARSARRSAARRGPTARAWPESGRRDAATVWDHHWRRRAPAARCDQGRTLDQSQRTAGGLLNLLVSALKALQARLGYSFRDESGLRLALTHPSVAHEQGMSVQHNQRLEFLGDAVLQLVLTSELYGKFPAMGEGPLTKARAQMVNRRTLANRGRRLGLGEYLILSRGEDSSGGRERPSALADTFEALLGAIFLDGGFDAARDFILRQFREEFGELEVISNLENPKGELQE